MIEPKVYVYISETKVNMFYEQLESSDVRKVGAEYGVDVKLFKWTGHRDRERIVTKQDKLKQVTEFLLKSRELGTLANPLRYFSGTLEMNWGSLAGEAVLFAGATAKEIVLLIGVSEPCGWGCWGTSRWHPKVGPGWGRSSFG